MTDTIKLWRAATARSMCHGRDCIDCNRIYGNNTCPLDIKVSDRELQDFVSKISSALNKRFAEEVFDFEMSDDEFVDILSSLY